MTSFNFEESFFKTKAFNSCMKPGTEFISPKDAEGITPIKVSFKDNGVWVEKVFLVAG